MNENITTITPRATVVWFKRCSDHELNQLMVFWVTVVIPAMVSKKKQDAECMWIHLAHGSDAIFVLTGLSLRQP